MELIEKHLPLLGALPINVSSRCTPRRPLCPGLSRVLRRRPGRKHEGVWRRLFQGEGKCLSFRPPARPSAARAHPICCKALTLRLLYLDWNVSSLFPKGRSSGGIHGTEQHSSVFGRLIDSTSVASVAVVYSPTPPSPGFPQ